MGRCLVDVQQLDNYTPDELDPTVMKAVDWLKLGRTLIQREGEDGSMVAEIKQLALFASTSSISLPRVFSLNNYLRSLGRPSYIGASNEKLQKRILPAVFQLVGFSSEVLDHEVRLLEDLMVDDGALVLQYASALKVMGVGSSLVEEVSDERRSSQRPALIKASCTALHRTTEAQRNRGGHSLSSRKERTQDRLRPFFPFAQRPRLPAVEVDSSGPPLRRRRTPRPRRTDDRCVLSGGGRVRASLYDRGRGRQPRAGRHLPCVPYHGHAASPPRVPEGPGHRPPAGFRGAVQQV